VFLMALEEVSRSVLPPLKANRQVLTEGTMQREEEGVRGAPAIRLCLEPLGAARPGNSHRVGQPINSSIHLLVTPSTSTIPL
jgi:hypothetical protein